MWPQKPLLKWLFKPLICGPLGLHNSGYIGFIYVAIRATYIMAIGKPLLSSHVGYITIHEPESHIQFGHVSHFFRQCVGRVNWFRYGGAKPFNTCQLKVTRSGRRSHCMYIASSSYTYNAIIILIIRGRSDEVASRNTKRAAALSRPIYGLYKEAETPCNKHQN